MERYDKDKIKTSLSIEEVYEYVTQLGGAPLMRGNDMFISQTICHNPPGEGSYKLYYYDNTHLFKCYTECPETGGFDIYELTCKVKKIEGIEWSLIQAIKYVSSYFGYLPSDFEYENKEVLKDWKKIEKYNKINTLESSFDKITSLKKYDYDILKTLPNAIVAPWIEEGINKEAMKIHLIKYNPVSGGVVIPHFDINGDLIGIRERAMTEEQEKFGKYVPAIINNKMYSHPLSFNLYNLNNSKNNIRAVKKAIVFESEKSTMMYKSHFGADNDISVACCGSSLIIHQVKLLLDLGVNEIIIAFDKQFKKPGDEEFKAWTKKLESIHNKYSKYVKISFVFDKGNLLSYKSSPIDFGPDIFLKLLNNRVVL